MIIFLNMVTMYRGRRVDQRIPKNRKSVKMCLNSLKVSYYMILNRSGHILVSYIPFSTFWAKACTKWGVGGQRYRILGMEGWVSQNTPNDPNMVSCVLLGSIYEVLAIFGFSGNFSPLPPPESWGSAGKLTKNGPKNVTHHENHVFWGFLLG